MILPESAPMQAQRLVGFVSTKKDYPYLNHANAMWKRLGIVRMSNQEQIFKN